MSQVNLCCAVCGRPFAGKRPWARYCSPTCRKRARRNGIADSQRRPRRPASLVALPNAAPVDSNTQVPEGRMHQPGPVEAATRAKLEAAGRLAEPVGQGALVLARRLDDSALETGAGLAALSKQHHASLEAALAGAKTEPDLLDELAARRDAKLGRPVWSPV